MRYKKDTGTNLSLLTFNKNGLDEPIINYKRTESEKIKKPLNACINFFLFR
jgi:hypothetical protein